MALQIANPNVVEKIERLSSLTGLNKTAAVEAAVDRLLEEAQAEADRSGIEARMAALIAQMDRVPDRRRPFDPLEWDELGLPR